MTIKEAIESLKSKKISSQELVNLCLNKIAKYDAEVNAFITVIANKALKSAREVDEEIEKSSDVSELFSKKPLLGIPIAHKDIFSTKDIETTAGSNILKGYIPPYDATVVKKLKKAGAIVLGKLNCDAFAHGASGENSDFGLTKNPYDVNRVSGGSSSGTGVSVAMEMTLMSTGTDTGGSLRLPAAFTNTVAIKPTYGRVSRYGIIAMASSLDSIGHITTTVEDSAYVLSVTAGFDSYDATTSGVKVKDYLSDIKCGVKGIKIGIPDEYFVGDLDPEIDKVVKEAIDIYEKLGATVVKINLPHTEYALAAYYIIVPSEVSSNLARFDGIRYGHTRAEFGDEAKRRIMIGSYTLSAGYYDAYYLKAQKVRALIIQDFKKAFEKVDVILAPVAPMLVPQIGENVEDPLKMYLMDILATPVNLAGIPSLSVPAGFSKLGLPIGIQLMGSYFNEDLLYKVGYALEQELKLYQRKPKLYES